MYVCMYLPISVISVCGLMDPPITIPQNTYYLHFAEERLSQLFGQFVTGKACQWQSLHLKYVCLITKLMFLNNVF